MFLNTFPTPLPHLEWEHNEGRGPSVDPGCIPTTFDRFLLHTCQTNEWLADWKGITKSKSYWCWVEGIYVGTWLLEFPFPHCNLGDPGPGHFLLRNTIALTSYTCPFWKSDLLQQQSVVFTKPLFPLHWPMVWRLWGLELSPWGGILELLRTTRLSATWKKQTIRLEESLLSLGWLWLTFKSTPWTFQPRNRETPMFLANQFDLSSLTFWVTLESRNICEIIFTSRQAEIGESLSQLIGNINDRTNPSKDERFLHKWILMWQLAFICPLISLYDKEKELLKATGWVETFLFTNTHRSLHM